MRSTDGQLCELIELTGGLVTKSTTITARGAYVDPAHIGHLRFYVSYIEPEGEWHLWDGASYDDAIIVAENARRMFGVSELVRDLVGGING